MKLGKEQKETLLNVEKTLANISFPRQIIIETTSFCNMKCLHCNHKIMKRKKTNMSDVIYKKIIDEIAELAPDTEVWPTFYGEALVLGDNIFKKLAYATQTKKLSRVVLNSNGRSLVNNPDYIDKILNSGLKRFILSLDGFTKETFEKIRVGGNRDKIYEVVESLLRRKYELGLEYPVIQCQFSIMDENEHEIELFKSYWEARGAEVKTRNKLSWTNSGDVVANNLDYDTDFRIACPWGINTCAIHSNGNVVACAVDYEGLFIAGNIGDESISKIWNGNHYEKLRKLHLDHKWNDIPQICKTCPDWQAVGAKYHENKEQIIKADARPFWWKKENESKS